MYDSLGTVKYNEHLITDRLQRSVDEKLRHWMHEQHLDGSPARYEVSFFDEDILEEVSCMVLVQSGNREWRSWETAANARQAFSLSLERMHESENQHVIDEEEIANGQRGSAGQRPAVEEQAGPAY